MDNTIKLLYSVLIGIVAALIAKFVHSYYSSFYFDDCLLFDIEIVIFLFQF